MRPPPRSATRWPLSVVALAAALAVAVVAAPGGRVMGTAFAAYPALLPCLAVLFVIAAGERWWRHGGVRSLADRPQRPLDLARVARRLAGFAATLALVALAYWLLPEYHGGFYAPYWRLLALAAPALLLVPPYFLWADRRLVDPEDEYLAVGRLVVGGWRDTDWARIGQHFLGWTVKAFFLPLMTCYLDEEYRALANAVGALRPATLPGYQVGYHLAYFIDLVFCVVGYGTATRWLGTEIRSTDPTVTGWLAALVCYQPFYSVVGRLYLQYDDNIYWDNWLQAWPTLRAAWGALIVLLALLYALSTVAFGLRFSNLTHRGIITAGPYRYSKHPAYLAKNLSWWLISVPWVAAEGPAAALRNCCLLGLVNLLYVARARTEERHLSRDPAYVAYALWIDEHGLLAGLGRRLPFLRYRPPTGRERLTVD
jgi:protein-S-isoprenylcysteine O-methyltransferase Ste14